MGFCSQCGTESSPNARYCRSCGSGIPDDTLSARDHPTTHSCADWADFNEILDHREKQLGGIGVLLTFFSAFTPWVTTQVSVFGIGLGSVGTFSSVAWLLAVAAVAAGIFLFRRRSGTVVMVIGIGLSAWALLSALITMGSNSSPSWGAGLAFIGGGLLGYSGYLTTRYET